MRKIYLTCISGIIALCLPQIATAQNDADEAITCTPYTWTSKVSFTAVDEDEGGTYTDKEYLEGIFQVSNNGSYAVASSATRLPYPAIFFDVDNNKTYYVAGLTGEKSHRRVLSDVADNGRIAGLFIDEDGNWTPGVGDYEDNWTELPQPDGADTEYINATDNIPEYCTIPRAISSDGKTVAGAFPCWDTAYYADGTSRYSYFWEPCLWLLDDDGNVIETRTYKGQPYRGQGFMAWGMSDDGRVITGMGEVQDGGQCPAVILDGELKYIAEPNLIQSGDDENVWFEDGNSNTTYWKDGQARFVDAQGNVYFHYRDGQAVYHSGTWNYISGETTEYTNGFPYCGANGLVLGVETLATGPALILSDDQTYADDISQLDLPYSISDDGSVVAGSIIISNGYSTMNTPAVLKFSGDITGIHAAPLEDITISRREDLIIIGGEYDKAELYAASGQLLASSSEPLSLAGRPAGVYVVKVRKGTKTADYKILK
ncbi:MAG: T9SS type A sorting domain-containing protein [Prevotella sp.]|nr:T9SS type A sorting domain-containing protein [Prevotella sp.]